ncbi:MAG: hypothetical protein ACW99U_06260 [Candidatus Thorarchaeota archaeon]|jgi:hypothetical protein
MIILKHIEHKLEDLAELVKLVKHVEETTSRVSGVRLLDIYFPRDENEFILLLECTSEESYLEWRDICPPPNGARDWYEVMLTKNEQFR